MNPSSYAHLPERFYARVQPTHVAAPALIKLNVALASELNLDLSGLDAPALAIELAGHVQQTAQVPGQNRFRTGCDDIGCLVGDHLVRDLRVFDAERAAKAAAYLGTRQFRQPQPGNRGEELPRLVLDPKLAQA